MIHFFFRLLPKFSHRSSLFGPSSRIFLNLKALLCKRIVIDHKQSNTKLHHSNYDIKFSTKHLLLVLMSNEFYFYLFMQKCFLFSFNEALWVCWTFWHQHESRLKRRLVTSMKAISWIDVQVECKVENRNRKNSHAVNGRVHRIRWKINIGESPEVHHRSQVQKSGGLIFYFIEIEILRFYI